MIDSLSSRDQTILFATALALRLLLLAGTAHDPIFSVPMLDAEYLVDWARDVAGGGVFGSPEGTAYFRLPLYPWFLAGAFALPGDDLLTARVAQALLGAGAVVVLAGIAGRRFGRVSGWATGLLTAFAWPALLFGRELLIESLTLPLGALVLHAWDRADTRPTPVRWGWFGATIAVSTLARPNAIVLIAPALLFFGATPNAWRLRGALLLGAAILLLPITVRNRIVSGDWVPLSYQGGLNLWIGNHPGADGMSARLPGFTSWRNEDVEAWLTNELGHAPGPREQDAFFRTRAIRFVVDEPGQAFELLLRKTYLFWQGYEIRNNHDLYALRERNALLRLPLPDFGWIAPLAALGLFAVWRRRRELAFLYGHVVVAALATIAFFVCARYRLPVWPPLLLFAGAGIAWLAERPLAAPTRAGRVALLTVLVALARIDFADIRHPDASQTHFQYGNVYARTGDAPAAEREYREALALAPGFSEARYHLGALYLAGGRIGDAIPELRSAAASMPLSFRARRSLAEALEHAGRFEEALAVRVEAARLSARAPDDVLALANSLGRAGRHGEAGQLYDELRTGPLADDPYLLLNSGQTALYLEDEARGLAELKRATNHDATREDAFVAIANYQLARRQTTEALRTLSEALLHVSDSVTLHRLRALARYANGDVTGAIEDLEIVVALDPGDAASRTRLEDLRAGRTPSR